MTIHTAHLSDHPLLLAPSAQERQSAEAGCRRQSSTSAARERRSLWLVRLPSRARPGPARKDALSPLSGRPSPSTGRAAGSGSGVVSHHGTCPVLCPPNGPGRTRRQPAPLLAPCSRASVSSSHARRATASSPPRMGRRTSSCTYLTSRASTCRWRVTR
uniref:Cold shock domain containing C2 n=1 Tax=Rousettus aegyptiacus TaxID=9407 RepID=A0A7J8JC39_ROUAE|nr:cold shock domain containing C2 [Rousettus aegyptiacus]